MEFLCHLNQGHLFLIFRTGPFGGFLSADLRVAEAVEEVVRSIQPEIILHFAAQPIVRRSYTSPVSTFASNIMGTVHVLDALRCHAEPKVIIVVTSDKVYENDSSGIAFRENSRLGGHDPIQPPRLLLKLLYLHIVAPISQKKVFRLSQRAVVMLLVVGFLKIA